MKQKLGKFPIFLFAQETANNKERNFPFKHICHIEMHKMYKTVYYTSTSRYYSQSGSSSVSEMFKLEFVYCLGLLAPPKDMQRMGENTHLYGNFEPGIYFFFL